MYEIKYMKLLSQIVKRKSFICKKQPLSIEKDNPSDKVVTIEEELEAVEVDGMGNLMDLPRLMFIDEE